MPLLEAIKWGTPNVTPSVIEKRINEMIRKKSPKNLAYSGPTEDSFRQ